MPDHAAAFEQVKQALIAGEGKVINSLSEVSAIGHRVVQGGAKYDHSVRIDDGVLADIQKYASLAPLHNPAHIQGINAATAAFGKEVPQVAVFDTAFHQTMPPKAYMFGVPYEYYEKYGVRRYASMEPPTAMSAPAAASCWASRTARGPGSSPATWAMAPPSPLSRTAG